MHSVHIYNRFVTFNPSKTSGKLETLKIRVFNEILVFGFSIDKISKRNGFSIDVHVTIKFDLMLLKIKIVLIA